MKKLIDIIHRFFFEEVSASGFGLMRIAWAFTVLIFMLGSAADVVRYYSEAGILPEDLFHLVFRSEYRFTILDYITTPEAVVLLWSLFMVCLVCMMVGLWPRVMTVTCVLLLFSFHERNLQPLGGGDTVLRSIGLLLMIAPEVGAFSLSRLEQQWHHWQKTGRFLPALKTHIWPYRLLLWQLMVIYLTSGMDKLQGTMWLDGTVVEAVFHHTHFARYGATTMNSFMWLSPIACFYTIIWEYMWLLLLVPKSMWNVLPQCIRKHSLKRWIILGGLLFHWGIFTFMDVGAFPFAMSTAYIGLLLDDDWNAFKAMANRKWKGRIIVLYDGICGLCRRSIFMLQMMDPLERIKPVDFRDTILCSKHAPDLAEQDLDRAMHIKTPAGRFYKGFDAFRVLAWNLPWIALLAPLFYLPGVAPVGRMVYAKIAESRNRCADGVCSHNLK